MTRPGGIRIYVLVWVAAIGFLLAGLVSMIELSAQQRLIFQSFRTGTWAVVQLDAEALRLDAVMARRIANPEGVSADDVMLAFDIFYSRMPLILTSQEAEGLREIPGLIDLIQKAQAGVPALEAAATALDPAEPRTLEHARIAMEAVRGPIRDAVQLTLINDRSSFEQRMRTGQNELVGAFALMIVIGGGMVLVALDQARRSDAFGRQAREAAAAAETARTRLVDGLNSVTDGFVFFDAEGRLELANESFREYFAGAADVIQPGVEAATLLTAIAGRGLVRLGGVSPEDWVAARLARFHDPHGSTEVRLADGRILLVGDRRKADGGVVSVFTDVTELTRARELLGSRLHAMEASLDGIALVDANDLVVYANVAMARIFGIEEPGDLIGRPWQAFTPPEELANRLREGEQAVIAEGRWQGESMALRGDGTTVPIEVAVTRLPDDGLAVVVRDVSARKQAEAERAQLREQFFNAQKLEAVGRLAGGIAHDFNNILAAVNGYAHLLVEDLPVGSEPYGFARQIQAAGERAKELVKEILAFSRAQQAEHEDVRLAAIVDETVGLLRATLPAHIRLEVHDAAPDATINANATQIAQVVMNLCVNARDAIAEREHGKPSDIATITVATELAPVGGGRVEGLRLSAREGGEGPVVRIEEDPVDGLIRMWVGVLDPGPHVRLVVRDTGAGMERSVMERMFEPFFTTKEVGQGTGLGLAAVHGIVTQHGGALVVDSRPGHGTTFAALLPLAQATAAAPADPGDNAGDASGGTGTILVVDDEDMVGTLLARSLERLGYEVVWCAAGDEALEAIQEAPAAFDLIVTDQTMPGMSGMDLARAVLRLRPGLPIILCTGFSEAVTEDVARAAGVAAFLHKPVAPGELAALVRRLLAEARAAA